MLVDVGLIIQPVHFKTVKQLGFFFIVIIETMIFTMVRSIARNGHWSFGLCIQGDSMTMRSMRPGVECMCVGNIFVYLFIF